MNSILDNDLVRKYFGCDIRHQGRCNDESEIALRILAAMQQPIKKGERILGIRHDSSIYESTAAQDRGHIPPYDLRLPDQFQKQECDHRAYEKRCTLCPYVEAVTDWIDAANPKDSEWDWSMIHG